MSIRETLSRLFRWRKRRVALTPEQMLLKFETELAERRKVEQELAHLASFAEMDPNCVLETDLEGRVLYTNIIAQEQFPDLASRGPAHPLLDGLRDVLSVLHQDDKTLLTRPVRIDERVFRQQISLIERGSRLRIYMTDITELHRLDRLKTEFVNTVSHELRTPLTGLQASVKLLHHQVLGPLNSDQQNAMALAIKSIDRLERLINNLLDVSKIEAGKMDLKRESVAIHHLLVDLQQSFLPLAREKGLDLRVQVGEAIPTLYVDRDKILQVLTNFLTNAMKFTSKGWIELRVELRDGLVVCAVRDTGPGISATNIPKLFGKFQQVGTPSTTREKGTGLGLSLCKGIVELHQGKVWVDSVLGEGSTFSFSLPCVSAEEIFRDQVHTLFENAVATEAPLSLIKIQWRPWPPEGGAVTERFLSIVRSLCRESDPLLDKPGEIWIAAPGLSKAEAGPFCARLQKAVQEKISAAPENSAARIDTALATYPDDAHVLEQLFTQLQ